MVMYKCDSFGSESRNTITKVFHRILCTIFTQSSHKVLQLNFETVVLICEGILGLDVLGNPADT